MEKKILLVDDEQFITIAYRDGLTRSGFTMLIAHNGTEALDILKTERPDLVLLDLVMPMMNGFDVLKQIKGDPQLASIPVIILSNLSQESDEAEARRLGAADFYVKSDLSLAELIKNIHAQLGE